MPLSHKKSTVVFIMPYHAEPLDRLEKMLTKKQVDKWIGLLQETAIAVSLPKVSMEVSHDLQVNNLRVCALPQNTLLHCHYKHFMLLLRNTSRSWA